MLGILRGYWAGIMGKSEDYPSAKTNSTNTSRCVVISNNLWSFQIWMFGINSKTYPPPPHSSHFSLWSQTFSFTSSAQLLLISYKYDRSPSLLSHALSVIQDAGIAVVVARQFPLKHFALLMKCTHCVPPSSTQTVSTEQC